jgi:isopenicillin-N N-acyltransferase like protein
VTPPTLELLRLTGTHREVGGQMGEAGRARIHAAVEAAFAEDLPAARTRQEQLRLAERYRTFTAPRLPWLLERLDACAEAAGVDPLAFFATTVEELWYDPRVPATQGRCSDLVAGPSATADGHLLVGHTNDLRPAAEDELVAMEVAVPGEPTVLQLGGIPWLSVGWNDAGLSLTGNELSPNDERVGISRSHQVLEMIRTRTLDTMVAEAMRPDRASSYNNVLASADGEVVNVEGSATDAELTGLDARDHLAHTNHYACERMVPFEGDTAYAVRSARRLARARALLAARPAGSITPEGMRAMLSDHEGGPDAICRHPDAAHPQEKTVFWCVADLTEGRIDFGRGNPCDSVAQGYVFAAWPGR